jgi:hypothetical protein
MWASSVYAPITGRTSSRRTARPNSFASGHGPIDISETGCHSFRSVWTPGAPESPCADQHRRRRIRTSIRTSRCRSGSNPQRPRREPVLVRTIWTLLVAFRRGRRTSGRPMPLPTAAKSVSRPHTCRRSP